MIGVSHDPLRHNGQVVVVAEAIDQLLDLFRESFSEVLAKSVAKGLPDTTNTLLRRDGYVAFIQYRQARMYYDFSRDGKKP